MPLTHEVASTLPAVSGSSGHLVVHAPAGENEPERQWPGRIFEQAALSYEEAMAGFIAARQAQLTQPARAARESGPEAPGPAGLEALGSTPGDTLAEMPTAWATPIETSADVRARRQALRQEEEILRIERRTERERRRASDAAWRALRAEHRAAQARQQRLTRAERRAQAEREARLAQQALWQAARQQRQQEHARRRAATQDWRDRRQQARQQRSALSAAPLVTVWVAILVLVDNCTRQSLGLPLFALGAHVTAEAVVEALAYLLPPELHYLITDGGTHFTSRALQQLAHARDFVRVPLARHRPESNGIAERFVLTLKLWLKDQSWHSVEELAALLARFLAEYNDRPHQAEALAGLSPNEYAGRMGLV